MNFSVTELSSYVLLTNRNSFKRCFQADNLCGYREKTKQDLKCYPEEHYR